MIRRCPDCSSAPSIARFSNNGRVYAFCPVCIYEKPEPTVINCKVDDDDGSIAHDIVIACWNGYALKTLLQGEMK